MSNLIFAGNLHAGGGVQVAISFIQEISQSDIISKENTDLLVSSRIDSELAKLGVDTSCFKRYYVEDFFGAFRKGKIPSGSEYNTCFVVFGPIYYRLPAKRIIVGFAQPWIAYSKNDAYDKLSFLNRVKNKIKYKIQELLFKNYEVLVVEHEHIKKALVSKGFNNKIHVVSNTVSSYFDGGAPSIICDFPILDEDAPILGFVGRNYTHKNLDILGAVSDILSEKFNFKVNFVFTLTAEEMQTLDFIDRKNFHSVGELTIDQCPDFYHNIDALIFPSMLECFSAAPLEAMKMSVPVIAADYPFVTEVCTDVAVYFDATDAYDIAEKIYDSFENKVFSSERLERGRSISESIPTPKQRALHYWEIIN
ncbi:Glycosyltransferase involved in cell wall bisynthesis [Vibrio xiamenensis]|uniref:Glycosyltransferase involved in cell wall bisynthesis n=1 Tax=Vibrio xiamenensis TaxID=861298 RepID=A0A1G8EXT4_9VIBR|nr:glycosyltransferase family 4 protein [Vibrio xiamenensis]SDH74680.1 Glycosyltransferase involved in cell wall bisynthesis [Vibrio xiamenensis]